MVFRLISTAGRLEDWRVRLQTVAPSYHMSANLVLLLGTYFDQIAYELGMLTDLGEGEMCGSHGTRVESSWLR